MPSTAQPSRGRVLIAEGDPDAAYYLVYVLGQRGPFSCTHTADPAAALALAAGSAWDLAVIDLDLPGMTGFELLAAIRLVAPSVPVIIVSADDPALLAPAGPRPDAFLAKPVPAALLLATALALRSSA
jgi:CheY-like chemotaxis protein